MLLIHCALFTIINPYALKGVGIILKSHTHHTNLSPSVRPSVFTTMEQVMLQVEYHCFASLKTKWIDPLYKELCLIIADVLVLEPDTIITINGAKMAAFLIQEVYGKLNNDHLRFVFANFQNVSHHVHNKKAYLRTALYNAVFEIESHFVNNMNRD